MNIPENPITVITKILDIAAYKGDKSLYAREIVDRCESEALMHSLASLPLDKQKGFKDRMMKIMKSGREEETAELIKAYISEEQYKQALTTSTEMNFLKLLQTISPKLTKEQKTNLQSYLLFFDEQLLTKL